MVGAPNERKAAEAAAKGLKSFLLYMLADFALIAGVVLVLFGIGEFLSKAIGIAGSGDILLGILLILLGMAVLSQGKTRIQIGVQPPMQPPMPPEMQQPPPPPPDAGTYR